MTKPPTAEQEAKLVSLINSRYTERQPTDLLMELEVTNNRDSGPGSLRAALESRSWIPPSITTDIKFITPQNATPNNSLGTGYWTIELESPLPMVTWGNTRINPNGNANIVITSRDNYGWGNSKGPSEALITIGDPEYMYGPELGSLPVLMRSVIKESSYKIKDFNTWLAYKFDFMPKVTFDKVHFINHEALGESGGAGGGLGSGAAMAIFDGMININNSTFQNLEARGGNKGNPGSGGIGGNFDGVDQWTGKADLKKGWGGWPGGAPSFPVWNKLDKNEAKHIRSFLKPKGGSRSGGNGENGKFGYGGGGGGGSDAGFHESPVAGRGGNGGVGGGGGAGGGAGATQYYAGKGRTRYQTNLNVGEGGDGYENGANGNRSNRDYGGKAGQSGGGAGWGGAIAILQRAEGEPMGLGYLPSAISLHLDSVDFINTTASSKSGLIAYQNRNALGKSGPNAPSTAAYLTVNDVRYAEAGTREPQDIFSNPDKLNTLFKLPTAGNKTILQLLKERSKPFSEQTDPEKLVINPFHNAISSPYKEDNLRLRPVNIKLNKEISDSVIISYEGSSSGLIDVQTDMSDPDNPLNKIWKKLVPDRTEEIKAKFESQKVTDVFSIDMITDIGKNLLNIRSLRQASAGSYTGYLGLVGTGAQFVGSMIAKHYENVENNRKATNEMNAALDINQKELEELNNLLQSNKKARLSQINTRFQRTQIDIKDFVIGEDLLSINLPEDKPPFFSAGQGNTVLINSPIDVKETAGTSTLAKLEIGNTEDLKQGGETTVTYLNKLLKFNKNIGCWQITPFLQTPYDINQFSGSYEGGPAHETFLINRGASLENKEQVIIQSGKGDDVIYASKGLETVRGGDGQDVIVSPINETGLIDDISGGSGLDTAIFIDAKQPLKFKTKPSAGTTVDVYNDNQKVATLSNVEIFEAYAGSSFDLSGLSDGGSEGFYSAVIGSGSRYQGSIFDDRIVVSYDDALNGDSRWTKFTAVNGGAGTNRITVDFQGYPTEKQTKGIVLGSFGSTVQVRDRESSRVLLKLENIQEQEINGTEKSDHFIFDSEGVISTVSGGDGDDIFDSSQALTETTAYGDDGNDLFIGGEGKNQFFGGADNDTMIGGSDDDYFDGGEGIDSYAGGTGEDIYAVGEGETYDIIRDFNLLEDKLKAMSIVDLSYLKFTITDLPDEGNGAMISVGNTNVAFLLGLTQESLSGIELINLFETAERF